MESVSKGPSNKLRKKRFSQFPMLKSFERLIELISILQILANATDYELLNPHNTFTLSLEKHKLRTSKIYDYVEKHFGEEIDISKVASLVNLSVPSFCNYFKKTMNVTFTDFLNQYRIQHACILLQQEKTVAEISFAWGFNNVTYFNKVFKSVTKKNPSQFKKKI